MTGALAGGVFGGAPPDELGGLRDLVDAVGAKSTAARLGARGLPERFDHALWADLGAAGLTDLLSSADSGAGPIEFAVVLCGLGRHSAAVPLAETDLLARWLAARGELATPNGPLTLAFADARAENQLLAGTAAEVPWARDAAGIVVAVRQDTGLVVTLVTADEVVITDRHNLAGEPRETIEFMLPAEQFVKVESSCHDEVMIRGAWARCVQIVGTLDAAAHLSVTHTREREQFGRPLGRFQSVQHTLAEMAGEIERFRATVEVAVAAAHDYGFADAATQFAVSTAKVVGAQVVPSVARIAHQLHGAIGTTIEHPLWLATTRAQSWIEEFGSRTYHAVRIAARLPLVDDPWDAIVGDQLST